MQSENNYDKAQIQGLHLVYGTESQQMYRERETPKEIPIFHKILIWKSKTDLHGVSNHAVFKSQQMMPNNIYSPCREWQCVRLVPSLKNIEIAQT